MEKLQWFKFTPSDWMMGKIQRCPDITQARFLRLCCLYWNKECELSKEDAIIEIDKEHFDCLESKKIISCIDNVINISFLDEQFLEIQEVKDGKSKSGLIGNLKRWHPAIYAKFKSKKISLEDAIKESQTVAKQSHTDSTPIADQSQNIADKKREDKIRLDKNRIEKNETKKPSKAKPSNADEVQSYFAERGYGEPGVGQQFIDHYDSIGWKRGKQPVKDWKATARTWMARMQNTTKNKCDTKVDETFRGVDW